MKAVLALSDGTRFKGSAFGAVGTVFGEVVFNTGMTGYQEVLTDPSCYGQIVTMTYPLIGNYGINPEDNESTKPYVKGFIVREACDYPSNWRSTGKLSDYLEKHNIIGIEGIDTRALTRILRDKGTMHGVISTDAHFDLDEWFGALHHQDVSHSDSVMEVTTQKVLHFDGEGRKIAVMDLGVKHSLIESLKQYRCEIDIFPAYAKAEEILAVNPDGIMLSNGPGNPKDCGNFIASIKNLLERRPVFGVGLGHQLVALARGADTGKLKYGHRGCNHPVKDLKKGMTYITSQNHGYVVLENSLDKIQAEISHINMNDGTVEGLRYLDKPVFSIQFIPETLSGRTGTGYLFDQFLNLIGEYST